MDNHTAPPSGWLLDIALDFARRGWSVIPIRHLNKSGKQPALAGWKEYQTRGPTEAELRRWFADGRTLDGLAVIFGDVSGGLVCRDFDEADAYHRWVASYPDLAATLPTVQTARGYHVYCRSSHRGIIKLGDGELRGAGYCLLPPSRHPSGAVYRWIVPLPEGELPELDPRTCGLAEETEKQRHRETETQRHRRNVRGHTASDLSVSHATDVEEAIRSTIPTTEGRRNTCLFELARRLKAIPSVSDAAASDLRPIVERWHKLAYPAIGTKPFDETWADFTYGWSRVRFPAGQDPLQAIAERAEAANLPPCAGQYDSPDTHRLLKVCRELQRVSGTAPFFLSCRTAGRVCRLDHKRAWKLLGMFVADAILEVVTPGTMRRATRYRYLGDGL